MHIENSPELVLNSMLDFTISEANFTDTQLIKEYLFTLPVNASHNIKLLMEHVKQFVIV